MIAHPPRPWRSAIYEGVVRHRRYEPRPHAFRFPLFMTLLDLDELPELFDGVPLWSARRPAPARFRRDDYLAPHDLPLGEAVRQRVERETGRRPNGPIRLLTHLRFFGHSFNPVSFYYCYDRAGARVESIVAEITNTPWRERHAYVLDRADALSQGRTALRWRFDKVFHVSPFFPLTHRYEWAFSEPSHRLAVHMRNIEAVGGERRVFDATLALRRREISPRALCAALARYPLMTTQVVAKIHFEALRLWLKRTPVFPHPSRAAGEPCP